MNLAEEFYKNSIEKNKGKSSNLNVKVNIIGWSRLIVALLAVLVDYFLYRNNKIGWLILLTLIFGVIFLFLILYHNNIFEQKKKHDLLIDINEKGVKRINGDFTSFKDNGAEYLDDKHSFINDLDIFGDKSIFQYINTTVTIGGRFKLVQLLKNEKKLSIHEIVERQEGIRELGRKVDWRQKLIVEGNLNKSKSMNLSDLIAWSKKTNISSSLRILISCVFIIVTVISIYIATRKIIPVSFLVLDFMVNYIVVKILS